MNYEIEKLDGSVKFSFTVPKQEWEEEINKSYHKSKGKYNIPGFRRGHATRRMIENLYGAGVFFDDAFNSCFKKVYSEALDSNLDIYPVDEPNVDITDLSDNGVKFTATVTIKPEVKLGEYKGLKIKKAEYFVDDDAVKAEIDKARERLSRKVEISDRAAQNGDITTIDYSGSVDGVKFDGGTAEKQELILGSGSFIPGFEEQVVGMKIGATKDINVKFPDEYHAENLKGKNAVFTVTLHNIKAKELPELDDAFAKDASKFETLDEFRTDIKNNLEADAKRREESENENSLLEKIVSHVECNIPNCMVETQLNYIVEDFKNRIQYMYQGLKFEDYLKYTGSTLDAFKKDRENEARNNVLTRLTMEEIIKQENIVATDEELDKKIEEIAERVKKTAEEYRQELSSVQIGYIKNDIVISKLMKFLLENNTFVKDSAKSSANNESKSEKKSPAKTTAKNGTKSTPKGEPTAEEKPKATKSKTTTK